MADLTNSMIDEGGSMQSAYMTPKQKKVHDALTGIHAHNTSTVASWNVKKCPFCEVEQGGQALKTMNRIKVVAGYSIRVYQCQSDFGHVAIVDGAEGTCEYVCFNKSPANVHFQHWVDFSWVYSVEMDFDWVWKDIIQAYTHHWMKNQPKLPEGLVIKPKSLYVTSDMHVGNSVALMEKLKETPIYKWDGGDKFTPMTNPCAEVPLPSMTGMGGKKIGYPVEQTMVLTLNKPVEKITVTFKVEPPKAYPMPLLNPKSAWGKRMKEKLAGKS